jgi:hypothetical protein
MITKHKYVPIDYPNSDLCKCGQPMYSAFHDFTMPHKLTIPNERQVGGAHYVTTHGLQHWDVVAKFDLDYFQGQITKYLFRWRQKNGIQDLEKALHFLEKYISLVRSGEIFDPTQDKKPLCDAGESAGRGYVDQDR